MDMAERGRFELPEPVKVRPLSRRVRSTTLPPLRAGDHFSNIARFNCSRTSPYSQSTKYPPPLNSRQARQLAHVNMGFAQSAWSQSMGPPLLKPQLSTSKRRFCTPVTFTLKLCA